jgi:hypothetical protein
MTRSELEIVLRLASAQRAADPVEAQAMASVSQFASSWRDGDVVTLSNSRSGGMSEVRRVDEIANRYVTTGK